MKCPYKRGMGNMGEVFDHYTDTAGNKHWTDTQRPMPKQG